MLFATPDSPFGGMKRTVKMHLLEDHMVDWFSKHQAGCGLMESRCRVDSCEIQLLSTNILRDKGS